jgi:hypothetical protein
MRISKLAETNALLEMSVSEIISTDVASFIFFAALSPLPLLTTLIF